MGSGARCKGLRCRAPWAPPPLTAIAETAATGSTRHLYPPAEGEGIYVASLVLPLWIELLGRCVLNLHHVILIGHNIRLIYTPVFSPLTYFFLQRSRCRISALNWEYLLLGR